MTLRDRPKAHTTKRAYKTLERGNSFVHVSRDADGVEEAVLLLDEETEAAFPSEEKHKDDDDPSPSVSEKIERLSNNNDPRKNRNSGRKVSDGGGGGGGGGEEKKSIGRRKASHSDPIPVDNSRERPPAPVWRYGEVEEVLQEIMMKEKEIKRLHKSLRLAFISLDNSKKQENGGDGGDMLEEWKENRKRTRLVRESFLSNSRKSVYEANGGEAHAAEQGEDNNEGDEGKGREKDVISSDIEAKEKGKEKIVVEEEKAGGEAQTKFAKAEQRTEVEESSKQKHSGGMASEEGGAVTSQQEAEPEDITYVAKEPGWKAVSERSITKYHTNPADPHLEDQRKRKKTLASILRGERICNDLLKVFAVPSKKSLSWMTITIRSFPISAG